MRTNTFWGKIFNLLLILLFLITAGLWLIVRIRHTTDAQVNYYFSLFLGVLPFVASFKGFIAAKRWGGLSSILGKSVGALSAGLFFWGGGELIWSYYNLIAKVAAPYPSLADASYVLGYIALILSALFLVKLSGVNLYLKKRPSLWGLVVFVVIATTLASYYLLVVVARQGTLLSDSSDKLKVFLDIFYPFADLLALTVATVIAIIAGKYVGGKLRQPIILVILGLATMYAGDVIFGYTTTKGTFYNADWGDVVLLLGMTILSSAVVYYYHAAPPSSLTEAKPTSIDRQSAEGSE